MGCGPSAENLLIGEGSIHDKYSLGMKLGEGTFGQVRAAQCTATREVFAVKILDVRQLDGDGRPVDQICKARLRSVKNEVAVCRRVDHHEHCVELFETFMDKRLCYLVMERCSASLMDKLGEMPTTRETDVARIFREMLLGIAHVHEAAVIHRDVKPDNFLYGGADGRTVKLGDFGLAVLGRPGASSQNRGGMFGTPPYMSPEMIKSKGYCEKTDVWSLGVTAHVLLYGDFPYAPIDRDRSSSAAFKQAILESTSPPIHPSDMKHLSEKAMLFVRKLLQRDVTRRVTAKEALDLAFLEPQSPDCAAPLDSPGLRVMLIKAKSMSTVWGGSKGPADGGSSPVVQRGLDELIQRLQAPGTLSRSFSVPLEADEDAGERGRELLDVDEDVVLSPRAETRIIGRRLTRQGSHSGVVSTPKTSASLSHGWNDLPDDFTWLECEGVPQCPMVLPAPREDSTPRNLAVGNKTGDFVTRVPSNGVVEINVV